MVQSTCTIEECSSKVVARGWCNRHYMRWKTYGHPMGKAEKVVRSCAADGCSAKHYALTYCFNHWRLYKKYGHELSGEKQCRGCSNRIPIGKNAPEYCSKACKPKPKPRPCTVDGCTSNAKRRGMCLRHGTAMQKYGDPLYIPIKPRCLVDDCGEPGGASGWCRKHYDYWRRTGSPLRPVNGTCAWCGEQFKLKSVRSSSFCSTRCRNASYWEQNKESLKISNKRYMDEHRELINERRRLERAENPGPFRDKELRWRRANRDLINQRAAAYRAENRESINRTVREWSKKNLERKLESNRRRRARLKGSQAFLVTDRDIRRMLDRYPGCVYCGSLFGDGAEMHIDHVMPLVRGGPHSKGNIVPACASCNLTKREKTVMEWRVWALRTAPVSN